MWDAEETKTVFPFFTRAFIFHLSFSGVESELTEHRASERAREREQEQDVAVDIGPCGLCLFLSFKKDAFFWESLKGKKGVGKQKHASKQKNNKRIRVS